MTSDVTARNSGTVSFKKKKNSNDNKMNENAEATEKGYSSLHYFSYKLENKRNANSLQHMIHRCVFLAWTQKENEGDK